MNRRLSLCYLCIALTCAHANEGAKPKTDGGAAVAGPVSTKTFSYDCESWAEGVPPQEVFVVDGTIRIASKDGGKAIMVDPNPIVDAYAQLGQSALGTETITAKFFASKKGRSYPRFGLSVHGNIGHRLIANCAKKQLELVRDDQVLKTAPLTWTTDTWMHLKLEAKPQGDGNWMITAKAWPADGPEPVDPTITHADKDIKGQGKAAIWGTPFSETPIYIDDIKIEAAVKAK
jgi:hypothetical protein